MAKGVAVVLLLALVLGAALDLASIKDCVTPDKVVEKNTYDSVYISGIGQEQQRMSTSLYVKPGSDFEYVCVRAWSDPDRSPLQACFSVESCDLNSTSWNLMEAEAEFEKNKLQRNGFIFKLSAGNCTGTKKKYKMRMSGIIQLSVWAHGSSEWLHNAPPDTCPDTTTDNPSSSLPTTTSLAPDTTTDNLSFSHPLMSPLVPMVVVVGLLVVAVILVVALAVTLEMVLWKRIRRFTSC